MHIRKSTLLALSALTHASGDDRVNLPFGLSVQPVRDYAKMGDQSWHKPLLAYFSIPYAKPPTGDRRFRPPEPLGLEKLGKAIHKLSFGDICLQSTHPKEGEESQSEDCLTLSVFKPQKSEIEKLPVLIWTPGGSFNKGSGNGPMVPGMVGNSPDDFIGVTINYRLGALGSLPSTLTKKAGLLNLGLADQLMAYHWVQKNIEFFGGDPKKVTIGGQSAGAHSVGAHLQHFWKQDDRRPFTQAILNSGGPTARMWSDWTYPMYEKQFRRFLEKTGCHRGEDEKATFDCLRSPSLEPNTIRTASAEIFEEYSSPVRWPFQPVVDREYIKQSPDKTWKDGSFNKVPVLTGFVTDEGSVFVPHDLKTGQDFRQYFKLLIESANSSVLAAIEGLYPDPALDSNSPYANSVESPQFKRISAAFTDYAYAMAVKQTAISLASFNVPVWKYHFDFVQNPGPNGVSHGAESSFLHRASSEDIGKVMNEYFSSFIVSGNPNAPGTIGRPDWPKYDPANPRQMTFTSKAEVMPDNIRAEQLGYWMSIAEVIPR